MIEEKMTIKLHSRAVRNSRKIQQFRDAVKETDLDTLAKYLENSFKAVEDIMLDTFFIICPFGETFVNSLETALKNYNRISTEIFEPVIKRMRYLIHSINTLKVPLNRYFMRIETFRIEDILNENIEKFNKIHPFSRNSLNNDLELLESKTISLKRQLDWAFKKFQNNLEMINFNDVQTASAEVLRRINSNAFPKSEINSTLRELNAALINKKICPQYLDENSERMKKLHERKNEITSLLNELHKSWEYLPERLQEYADNDLRIMFHNPLLMIRKNEIDDVIQQIKDESSALKKFAGNVKGDEFKRKWIQDIVGVKNIIFGSVRALPSIIGDFNYIIIKHIKSIIHSNAIIRRMPIVEGLLEDLDAFNTVCSSYVIPLGPEKLIINFTKGLSLNSKKTVISRFDVTQTNTLEKIIKKTIDLIDIEQTNIMNVWSQFRETNDVFREETKVVRLLLCKLKYVVLCEDIDNEDRMEMVTALVQDIRLKLSNASNKFQQKSPNTVFAQLSASIDTIEVTQKDLLAILQTEILPLKQNILPTVHTITSCSPC